MPQYCFRVLEAGKARDGDLVELPDLHAAKKMATDFAGELITEMNGDIFVHDVVIEVREEHGQLLYVITVTGTSESLAGVE